MHVRGSTASVSQGQEPLHAGRLGPACWRPVAGCLAGGIMLNASEAGRRRVPVGLAARAWPGCLVHAACAAQVRWYTETCLPLPESNGCRSQSL
jgi:hypothetical protein